MLYLDTAALVKLVRPEPESDALADWLDERPDLPWVSSALIEMCAGFAGLVVMAPTSIPGVSPIEP